MAAVPFEMAEKPKKRKNKRGRPPKRGRPKKGSAKWRAHQREKALQAPNHEIIPPGSPHGASKLMAKMYAHANSSKPGAVLVCDTAMDLVLLTSNWFDIHADGHVNLSRANVTVNEE